MAPLKIMKRFLCYLAIFLAAAASISAGELVHIRINHAKDPPKKIVLKENIIEMPVFGDFSDAVRVKRGGLVHTRQLNGLDSGKDDAGFADMIGQLKGICRAHDSTLKDVAKLNVYLADSDPEFVASVRSQIVETWKHLSPIPAVTLIPTPLPAGTRIAADAVIATDSDPGKVERFERDAATLPANRDILYVSGRAASGELAEATSGTMTQLFAVLAHLGSTPADVVQVKAFIRPMSGWEIVEREIEKSFGDLGAPPLVFVEWSSTSRATEIELIAAAPDQRDTNESISYFTPPGDKPSPVFSRVARIHANEVVYIGGLTGTDNSSPEAEVKTLYSDLDRVAKAAESDLRHFAKATYYVSDNEVSAALNKLRPEFYDPQRPPAASKVAVPNIGVRLYSLLIDMVGAPAKK